MAQHTATDTAFKHALEIDNLLARINEELNTYRAKGQFTWEEAGTLGEIERQLGQLWEFMAEENL